MKKETLGYLLTRASKTIKKRLLQVVSEYDLTQQQYGILRQLYFQEGISARNLVDQLYMDSSTVMSIIDRLEQKGLVKRGDHESDRRIKALMLTKKAKDFLPECLAKTEGLDRKMEACLNPAEKTALRSGLTKLYQFAIGIQDPKNEGKDYSTS